MVHIVRRWVCRIRAADRDAYASYIKGTGGVDYESTSGNMGYQMLMRDRGDGTTEVVTESWWTSMDDIRAFSGDDVAIARYYPEDDDFLIDRPLHVEHYEVVAGTFVDDPGCATPVQGKGER